MEWNVANDEAKGATDSLGAIAPWKGPAILLVDLDAFFASVEQLDHPEWRGKPVIVGGDPHKRGVVSTASYEARHYGVHSAMASSQAALLCPDAIWTSGNFHRYREVSDAVMAILRDETPHVQQVSIDEAFLDVTPTKVNREHPVAIAERIQKRVAELGVSCSVGVGSSKSIAKIASDRDKPQGLTVVLPGSERNFLEALPVGALSGIGPSTAAKLKALGIETLGQLCDAEDEKVISRLGKVGAMILARARGQEDSSVVAEDKVKSVSNETSFAEDLTERKDIVAAIDTMAAKVGRRLRRKGLRGRTLTLKVRYGDFTARSAQCPLDGPSDDEYEFMELSKGLLDELWQEGMSLRLVGVAISGLDEGEGDTQPSLFSVEEDGRATLEKESRRNLSAATDRVKERFGENALRFGRELRMGDSTTGSSSKNPADYKG